MNDDDPIVPTLKKYFTSLAPSDAIAASNPNAQATPGTPLTGIPGALVKTVAPVMNHPLATALAGLAVPAAFGAGAAAIPSVLAAGGTLAGSPAVQEAEQGSGGAASAAEANPDYYRKLFGALQGPSEPANMVGGRPDSPLSPEYSRIINGMLSKASAADVQARALATARTLTPAHPAMNSIAAAAQYLK